MGTLHVVSAPAGLSSDLTRRALQVLRQVALIVADDDESIQRLLVHYGLVALPMPGWVEAALEALSHQEVALLSTGWLLGLSELGSQLVRSAIQRGVRVVSTPGPTLPLTALVLSGLPAHSFVWMGEYSQQLWDRQPLLASFVHDPRTMISVASAADFLEVSIELSSSLGNRPLVVVTPSDRGAEVVWRGTLGEVAGSAATGVVSGRCVLVIGGAQEKAPRWEKDRLQARVEVLRASGLGTREISQQLADESGWPRREIYRMVVEAGRSAVRHKEEF